MRPAEQLAAERAHGNLKLAERLRYARRLRTLRRARRMELRAERRLITAWRRAAELRDTAELRRLLIHAAPTAISRRFMPVIFTGRTVHSGT